MSEFDVTYEVGNDYGDLIILNKYGDRYSLICGHKSQKVDGTPWKDFCYPQDKDKKPKSKAIPLGVRLGDRSDAVKFANWLLEQFAVPGQEQDDEDAPF